MARRRIRRVNCEMGIKFRAQFCMYMADLAVAYPYLSSKRANSRRVVRGRLYSA